MFYYRRIHVEMFDFLSNSRLRSLIDDDLELDAIATVSSPSDSHGVNFRNHPKLNFRIMLAPVHAGFFCVLFRLHGFTRSSILLWISLRAHLQTHTETLSSPRPLASIACHCAFTSSALSNNFRTSVALIFGCTLIYVWNRFRVHFYPTLEIISTSRSN